MSENPTPAQRATHATADQVHSAVRNLGKAGNAAPTDAAVLGLVDALASAVDTLNTEAVELRDRVRKLEDGQ